jgi:hypothetical protein
LSANAITVEKDAPLPSLAVNVANISAIFAQNTEAGGSLTFQWYSALPPASRINGAADFTYSPPTGTVGVARYYVGVTNTIPNNGDGGKKTVTEIAGPVTVTVINPVPTVTEVTVSPAASSVDRGKTRQFTATVKGTNNPATTVTWTVEGGVTGTVIGSNGLLTVADAESAATLIVRATSTVDATKSGMARVTVTGALPSTGITVTISPKTASVEKGSSLQFGAIVSGPNNPAQVVTWLLQGQTTSTIDLNNGRLTVDANETATTLTVRATSTVDTSKFDTATVTVTTPSFASVNRYKAVPAGGSMNSRIKDSYSYDGHHFYYIHLGELQNVPVYYREKDAQRFGTTTEMTYQYT